MPPRYGLCWNQDYCPVAHAHTLVRVDESALFVCPHCARPLRVASKGTARVSRTPQLAAGAAVLLVAAGAAAWLWPATPKPAKVSPVWVRMEEQPPSPLPVPVPVEIPAPVQVMQLASKRIPPRPAPAPLVAVLTAPAPIEVLAPEPPPPPEASVLMRLRGDPALAADLMPQLAKAFLRFTGDTDVEILRAGGITEVRGQSSAGLEAVSIVAAPPDAAFASLANGGAELVFSARAPTPDERRVLAKLQNSDVAKTPAGVATLFVPVPSDPVAVAFLKYANSPAGHAALSAAGFAPPSAPPAPAPKHPPEKPAKKAVAAPPAAPHPVKAPAVAAARPPPAEPPKQAVATPQPPPAPAPPPAAAAPPAVADEASVLGTTPPEPRTVTLPAGSKITFGPLKDVQLPAANPRMVFLQPGKTPRAPGKLQVDCMIQASGVPTDCRPVSAQGEVDVSRVIMTWLGSGAIRYSPATKNGHPVEERRVLTVNFREPAAHED